MSATVIGDYGVGPTTAEGEVTLVSCTSPAGGQGGSVSFAVNNTGGANGCLVLVSHLYHALTCYIDSVTFDTTQNFGLFTTLGATNDDRLEVWSLPNPNSGSHNVVVTYHSTETFYLAACWFLTGVNQTTPLAGTATNDVAGVSSSINVTSAVGDVVLDAISIAGDSFATLAHDGSQSDGYKNNGGESGGGSSKLAVGASTTMAWTWTGSSFVRHIGVAVKPA